MPAWKPGQSGNPNGRPPKGRTIASQIEKQLNRTDTGFDGKKHKRAFLLAEIFVNALLTGTVKLPNGTTLLLPPRDWMEVGKFVVSHIDGPAKAQVELSGDASAPLTIQVLYADHPINIAEPAPGTTTGEVTGQPLQRPGVRPAVGQDDIGDRRAD